MKDQAEAHQPQALQGFDLKARKLPALLAPFST